jgi:hypothetical protein
MIVTLNRGKTNDVYYYGSVTIQFDHPVSNNPANPYGIDFEVFGNAFYVGSGFVSDTTDIRNYNLTGGSFSETLLVSVSPDGVNWHSYNDGPYCDDVFPTQGYEWDAELFAARTNGWTKKKMDFTLPVNPALTNLLGVTKMSAANALEYYGRSGGGAGYSLAETGFDYIRYVRVQATEAFGYGGEVDAVADVRPATLNEPLVIGPANVANGQTRLYFQEPGSETANAVTIEFQTLSDYALVAPKRIAQSINESALTGALVDAYAIDIAPVIEANPVSFDASVSVTVSSRYAGAGDDLDVLSWDGARWSRVAFNYADGSVLVPNVTVSTTLAVVEITAPTLTAIYTPETKQIQFQFTSVAGWTHVLEKTSDFVSWTTVSTSTPEKSAKTTWTDATVDNKAFYRLRLVRP